jgi:hypothetical protein
MNVHVENRSKFVFHSHEAHIRSRFCIFGRKAQIPDQLHIMVMYISFYGF